MKLMMIQGGFGAGGAEKIMARLAAHRQGRGDQTQVAAMFMPPEGPFFPYPEAIPLTVLAPGRPRDKLLHLHRLRAIRRHILHTKPDLIVSFLTKVNCLTMIAAQGTGVPVIISERNNPRVQSYVWSRLQNQLARRAAAFVMQTDGGRDTLPVDLARRAVVIPNVCPAVPFTRPAPVPGQCRFVAVGRLDAQKGFDILIRAFAALPRDATTRLTIYGEGPERAALTRQIAKAGLGDRVTMPGLAATPRDWLQAGDVLVVSSRFEGFSNVVAEATCSGLPIISFDCPFGPREMVRDGLNGLLIPHEDTAALTRAMARLAADPDLRHALSQHGDVMARHLHPGRVMALWDAVIDGTMAARRAPGLVAQPQRSAARTASR